MLPLPKKQPGNDKAAHFTQKLRATREHAPKRNSRAGVLLILDASS
jgi:hypothetical protein